MDNGFYVNVNWMAVNKRTIHLFGNHKATTIHNTQNPHSSSHRSLVNGPLALLRHRLPHWYSFSAKHFANITVTY